MKFSKKIREQLARLASNPAELAKVLPMVCRAAHESPVLAVRAADGSALSNEKRDQLLAAAVAGEFVELEIDVLAYEQKAGSQNRNFVRFRDGAMVGLGRTGKGNPFLRDHAQHTVLARAGTITASSTEKLSDGEYVIHQTVKLSAPWAVELALRGLLGSVSIGWNPTGPVMCSDCNAPVFTKCWHTPGDRLRVGDDGKKRYDDSGDIVVEWVYTAAELIETSIVNVPGVPSARIDEIRAALSAAVPAFNGLRSEQDHEGSNNEEAKTMDKELLKLLGLAEDATEAQIKAAVEQLQASAKADKAQLAILEKLVKEMEQLKLRERQRDADVFISDALTSGRIGKGDEEQWRALFEADSKRAAELMAKRPENSATPVGEPRQSSQNPDKATPVITGGESLSTRQSRDPLAGRGVPAILPKLQGDPRAMRYAHAFGFDAEAARIAMPTTLGATAIANNADMDAARVGFHAAFLQQLEVNADDPLSLLYTTVQANRSVEEWNFMGDLPQFTEWKTDRTLADLKGFKLRVETKKWANGLRIKNDDFKDDALGLLPPQISGLAQKARRHRWDLMVKLLLNGFDGTAYPEVGDGLSYDGAFFFSDSHLGGNDNLCTAALDAAALSAAELRLESMKTLDGSDPLDTHGTHLIVGPKLRTTAEKLLQQERLASGEDNINRGKYKLIVSSRLNGTYDDYWFLADLSGALKPLLFQMREEISTMETGPNGLPAFTHDELWFGAQARYNVGYFEPRLIVGSVVA